MSENVDHPAYYGGAGNPYEVIKVAEAWGFDQNAYLFNVLKYIARPGKGHTLEDLKKARWYLDRLIARLKGEELSASGLTEVFGPAALDPTLHQAIERLENPHRAARHLEPIGTFNPDLYPYTDKKGRD